MKLSDKQPFHKKWYFRLLQVIFWSVFIFFIILGIWGIFYEDDIPLAGFFWAGAIAIIYWVIKKILYYALVRKTLPLQK